MLLMYLLLYLDERGVLCMGKQIHGYIGRN
ncbi:hypothetical protein OIU74_025477, partial [Salix koriyanagi]